MRELLSTAHLCLGWQQHCLDDLPISTRGLESQTLSSVVEEHNHYTCVHPGMQSSNSSEALTLPSQVACGLAPLDLADRRRQSAHLDQPGLFRAFFLFFSFFLLLKWQFFVFWLHRDLQGSRILQHSLFDKFSSTLPIESRQEEQNCPCSTGQTDF